MHAAPWLAMKGEARASKHRTFSQRTCHLSQPEGKARRGGGRWGQAGAQARTHAYNAKKGKESKQVSSVGGFLLAFCFVLC